MSPCHEFLGRRRGRSRLADILPTLFYVCLVVWWYSAGSAGAAVTIGLQLVADNLDQPVAITHAGDGSGRLFITLKGGQVLIYDGTAILPTPFLDISALVSTAGEQGLLSIAFHPNYAANGLFYVNYTDTVGDTVIAEYSVSADPDVADAGSATILLTIDQPFDNHNGGQLQFGPDGYLYIGMGDGGSGGDPNNNAQNRGVLLGKLLRIDVDGLPPYDVPADNPFVGIIGALPEIWATGLRNPWRFSFDRDTGDLFIADVGESSIEEVDFQPFSSAGGENYGWRLMEGSQCFNPAVDCNDGTLTLPVLEYSHTSSCSITGGYRYHGLSYPGLEGIYFFGDFCSGTVWGAQDDEQGMWSAIALAGTGMAISTFGENEDGEIYLAHMAAAPGGAVYRITTRVPGAPGGLQATVISSSQINLRWTDNAVDEDGFRVERKTGDQGVYRRIDTLGPDVNVYQDDALSDGFTYHYRVSAFNIHGDSAYSNPASAATPSEDSGGGCFIDAIKRVRR